MIRDCKIMEIEKENEGCKVILYDLKADKYTDMCIPCKAENVLSFWEVLKKTAVVENGVNNFIPFDIAIALCWEHFRIDLKEWFEEEMYYETV